MRYLALSEVLRLHSDLVAETDGATGVRDLGRIQAALAQPMATFDGWPWASQGWVGAMLVLDSGAVSRLAERSRFAAALILALREQDLWPPASF